MLKNIRLGPRFPHLLQLWSDWLAQDQPAQLDRWLKHWFKQHKNYGKKDRKIYADLMFAAQRYLQLACALDTSFRQPELVADDAAWLDWDSRWQWYWVKRIEPEHVWLWVLLRLDPEVQLPREMQKLEQRQNWFHDQQQNWQHPGNRLHWLMWYGVRPGWWPALQQRTKESEWTTAQLHRFVSALDQQPPVWLRPQRNMDQQQLLQQLQQQSVQVEIQEGQLCTVGGIGIVHTESYQQGQVEIQDLASQQIAAAVAIQPGMNVWDACAGAGGKSLAMAEQMNGQGLLLATDVRNHALQELARRAKRGGFGNIHKQIWNAEQPISLPKQVKQNGGFDRVLVDAPCTSSGTWRRSPDARWRLNLDELPELLTLQQKILRLAAQSVRPQGWLIYATCSWLVAENEQQVGDFLQHHPGFQLQRQTILGSPSVDADTMFVAVLERIR